MSDFWSGFYKRADVGMGGGFTGTGKGNLPTGNAEQGQIQGNATGGDGEDTRTDKTLLDRQRNPKDFSIFEQGQDGPADANPHITF